MTPRDHNRIIGLAHGLVGALVLAGIAIATALEAHRHPAELIGRLARVFYLLPMPLLQMLTSYGLLRRRQWGRILALLFSALYVFVFPLGTLLAIYTYWFLHSAGARRLYAKDKDTA